MNTCVINKTKDRTTMQISCVDYFTFNNKNGLHRNVKDVDILLDID